jgi:hypothetical protein
VRADDEDDDGTGGSGLTPHEVTQQSAPVIGGVAASDVSAHDHVNGDPPVTG